MTRSIPVAARAALGVAALAIVFVSLMGYLGEYRSAKGGDDGAANSPTSTVEPTATSTGDATASPGGKPGAAKPTDSKATVTVQIEGLNFRAEPEAGSMVIRGLSKGERLTWLATDEGWYKVEDKEGRIGWISSNKQYSTLQK